MSDLPMIPNSDDHDPNQPVILRSETEAPALPGMPVIPRDEVMQAARTALLQAQTAYIAAQHTFIHSKDLGGMILDQEKFIRAMSSIIDSIEPGKLAAAQEDMIATLGAHIHALGVV